MSRSTKFNRKPVITARQQAFIDDCKAGGVIPCNVSRRNKKLVPNAETAFIIWNLPAVKTCPFATDHCKALCYARKAEQAYPDCLPARERNFTESRQADFITRMAYTILSIRKGCRSRNLVVRIHESGDFYNLAYAKAWLDIMTICKGARVTFIAYTKSYPYFDGVTLPRNFSLRFSVWDDTKPQALAAVARNDWRIYTAVDKFQAGDRFTRCRCSDCATCGKCWQAFKDIRCEIH